MAIALWVLAAIIGVIVMGMASRFAVDHAVACAGVLRVPPFLIGITLVAVGTDLPEIINSITASYLGHGDINVGDSIGSVFTQGSILGLLPFIAGPAFLVDRRNVILLAGLTIFSLAAGVVLMADGAIGRLDAAILIILWLVLTWIAWRFRTSPQKSANSAARPGSALQHLVPSLLALAVVGGAAAIVVLAIATISATIGVHEYILSFFAASIGTSLPELTVEFMAIRRGQRQLAIGDGLGSCLVDASLSIAVGPLLFPIAVSARLATQGAIIAGFTMFLVALLVGLRGKLDRVAGSLLITAYVLAYIMLIPSA